MEPAPSQEDLCQSQSIHVLEVVKEDVDLLHQIVKDHLKMQYGVQVISQKKRESRAKSRTPGTPKNMSTNCFLYDPVEINLGSHNVNITIPRFLRMMCNFIKDHLEEQGLFRVGGSSTRISSLISSLDEDASESMDSRISVFDVCSALKQLIRKMDEPLIPPSLHHIFLRCLELSSDERNATVLLAVFLLPKSNLHIMFYLMQFLHDVAEQAKMNRMDSKNLAIVFAPNIMPLTSIPAKRCGKESDDSSCSDFINNHVEIVKILIEAGDKIGIASNNLVGDLVAALCKNSEDELEEGEGEYRKRKRSSSLNRALSSAAGVLEFICKKKSKKNAQTPVAISSLIKNTPGTIITPIIKPHSRARSTDTRAATPVSASAKNRLISMMNRKKFVDRVQTTGFGVFQSPVVCLNPRPPSKDDIGSAYAISKSNTNTLRMNKTLQRTNGSRSLPESAHVGRENTKSIVQIMPLTNSPRKLSPRIVDDLSENAMTPDCRDSSDHEHDAASLRFTPMVREIRELTLAALREESPSPTVTSTSIEATAVVVTPVALNCEKKTSPAKSTLQDRRCQKATFGANARRCQSFNDAYRARLRRTGHIPRRKSDGTSMLLRPRKTPTPPYSPISANTRKNTQSLITLNHSPSRCTTLRRGRPNTARAGLSRPSPSHKCTATNAPAILVTDHSTPINIMMDRKGRVSRRIYTRPALVIPSVSTAAGEKVKVEKESRIAKPPRLNLKVDSKLQSSKTSLASTKQSGTQQPISYVASKLKREADGTVIWATGETPVEQMPLTPGNRKGRSFSMRSDMIRPSPKRNASNATSVHHTLSRKLTTCYENPGNNTANTRTRKQPMKRGSSVQELVKKFDCNDAIYQPAFGTLKRDNKIGRLPLPNISSRNNGVANESEGNLPPPKPPRTSLLENRSNANNCKNKLPPTKQTSQFNLVNGNAGSKTNVMRGSNQVLKTINLA